jgi:hypothetical protein
MGVDTLIFLEFFLGEIPHAEVCFQVGVGTSNKGMVEPSANKLLLV